MNDYLTYNKQLEALKESGLSFNKNEESELKKLLKCNNFIRIFEYLKINNSKTDSSSFVKIKRIIKFDSGLRLLILKLIERIELTIRTQISYEISLNLGPKSYLNQNLYINIERYNQLIKEIEKLTKQNLRRKTAINPPPLFILVENLSFGQLSKLFNNLKPENQKLISEKGSLFHIKREFFGSYLRLCVILRNLCAHHSRLYGKIITIRPLIPKQELNYLYKFNCIKPHSSETTIFIAIYIALKLSPSKELNLYIINEMNKLINKYKNDIDYYLLGFPKNWIKILKMI